MEDGSRRQLWIQEQLMVKKEFPQITQIPQIKI
jgi:hypothetical protein